MSLEELAEWQRRYERGGLAGLKATKAVTAKGERRRLKAKLRLAKPRRRDRPAPSL